MMQTSFLQSIAQMLPQLKSFLPSRKAEQSFVLQGAPNLPASIEQYDDVRTSSNLKRMAVVAGGIASILSLSIEQGQINYQSLRSSSKSVFPLNQVPIMNDLWEIHGEFEKTPLTSLLAEVEYLLPQEKKDPRATRETNEVLNSIIGPVITEMVYRHINSSPDALETHLNDVLSDTGYTPGRWLLTGPLLSSLDHPAEEVSSIALRTLQRFPDAPSEQWTPLVQALHPKEFTSFKKMAIEHLVGHQLAGGDLDKIHEKTEQLHRWLVEPFLEPDTGFKTPATKIQELLSAVYEEPVTQSLLQQYQAVVVLDGRHQPSALQRNLEDFIGYVPPKKEDKAPVIPNYDCIPG